MRIIAGSHKRRQLKAVDSLNTRSTKDRVKESLFNMLSLSLDKTHVLDLFAGSGALGLEALSRGVKEATFVEKDKAAVDVIQENLKSLELNKRARVYHRDALKFLENTTESYDLVLLDPPYHQSLIDESLRLLIENQRLKDDFVIVLLSEKNLGFRCPDDFEIFKQKKIGVTQVTLLKGRQ